MNTASTTASRASGPGFWSRLLGGRDGGRDGGRSGVAALYAAIVAEARQPHWYRDHGVADTIDGRFDMVALVLSLVLLRLERDDLKTESVRLTEVFIDDMDGQMRETGFGDLVVGKQVGGIMAALGGRLGVYRATVDGEIAEAALVRNLYRGVAPDGATLASARTAVAALAARIAAVPARDMLGGRLT